MHYCPTCTELCECDDLADGQTAPADCAHVCEVREPDPLAALWRDTARPLNWRPWLGLNAAEMARLRCALIYDLQALARRPRWHWGHTHRELLELKAASGHAGLVRHEESQ